MKRMFFVSKIFFIGTAFRPKSPSVQAYHVIRLSSLPLHVKGTLCLNLNWNCFNIITLIFSEKFAEKKATLFSCFVIFFLCTTCSCSFGFVLFCAAFQHFIFLYFLKLSVVINYRIFCFRYFDACNSTIPCEFVIIRNYLNLRGISSKSLLWFPFSTR